MVAAARQMPFRERTPCAAHTLQSSVQKGLGACVAAVKTARSTSKQIKNNQLSRQMFQKAQKDDGITKLRTTSVDLKVRWTSTQEMLTTLLETKKHVERAWEMLERSPPHSETEWQQFRVIVDVIIFPVKIYENTFIVFSQLVLTGPDNLTTLLSGDKYPTLALVVPSVNKLFEELCRDKQKAIAEGDHFRIQILTPMIDDFTERWNAQHLEGPYLAMALNPILKNLSLIPVEHRPATRALLKREALKVCAIPSIQRMISKVSPTGEAIRCTHAEARPLKKFKFAEFLGLHKIREQNTENFGTEEIVENELKLYFGLPLLPMEEDPLAWWAQNKKSFPVLSFLARRWLAAPASSVPCERLFSKAGHILNKKRASLLCDNARALIMLASNK
eukprot:GCRY01008610.1.p1 GENE.GCRY01008610.1~~GCRY01008610.1.p1  ORF type:complete len:390 (+),score=20.96 GCRY01008610.1:666-1835(+)